MCVFQSIHAQLHVRDAFIIQLITSNQYWCMHVVIYDLGPGANLKYIQSDDQRLAVSLRRM